MKAAAGLMPIFGSSVILLLTACAPAMQETQPYPFEAVQTSHHKAVQTAGGWEMAGKLYLRYEDRKWRFGVRWQCQPGHYEFDLYHVGGRKIVQFRGTPEFAEVKDGRGKIKRAADDGLLMQEMFGMEVPSALSLCEWLAGLPSKRALIDDYRLDAHGRFEQLVQLGWHIDYKDYFRFQADTFSADLPKKITFEKDEVHLTVDIAEWTPLLQ